MAFVPRKNKIVFEDSSIDKSSESKTLRKSQKLKKRDDLKREVKTYNDMTIEALNILESQGIDIYDPNRKPGMYQRGKKGIEDVQKINVIKSLSKDNKKSEDLIEDKNTNITSLLNFFKKDNK
jgi:hypothetical protein